MNVAFCGGSKQSEADKTKDPDDNLAFPRLNGGGNKYSSRTQHSLLRLKLLHVYATAEERRKLAKLFVRRIVYSAVYCMKATD